MKDQKSLKLIIRKSIRRLFLISFLIFIFISCATFQSKQRLDLSPFANSMIAVAGDIQYSLFQHRLVTVRKLAIGQPEVEKFGLYRDKLRRVIRGIIAYSIEIVTVAESNKSGEEKARALADYLESLKQPILEKPMQEFHFTVQQLDTIIMDVRSQKKFLDALGAAQPLIDEVARTNGELTEQAKTQLDVAYQDIQKKWTNEYSDAIWAMKTIKKMQFSQLLAGYHVGQYLRGNQSSLDSFYVYDPLSRKLYPEGHQLDAEDILDVEKRLYYNLAVIQDIKLLYQQDIIDYEEGLLELDEVKRAYNDALRQARLAILMWSRAHLQLSRGVTDPAAIDIMQLMLGTAKKFVPGM